MQKLIFTGPECSGKTTLTRKLAQALDLPYTTEYVRAYLDQRKSSNYEVYASELPQIVYGQIAAEQKFRREPLLICDTNILSNLVYIEYYFKTVPNWLAELFKIHCGGYYILLKPNIPFKFDPQRTGGQERQNLFYLFKKKLEAHNLDFSIVETEGEAERLALAKAKCLELIT